MKIKLYIKDNNQELEVLGLMGIDTDYFILTADGVYRAPKGLNPRKIEVTGGIPSE